MFKGWGMLMGGCPEGIVKFRILLIQLKSDQMKMDHLYAEKVYKIIVQLNQRTKYEH